jgi:S1-C subfamily serine protease
MHADDNIMCNRVFIAVRCMYHLMPSLTSFTYMKIVLTSILTLTGMLSCKMNNMSPVTSVPYDSFVFVEISVTQATERICDTSDPTRCDDIVESLPIRSRGSGVIVDSSRIEAGRQYVMTAGHMCDMERSVFQQMHDLWKLRGKDLVDLKLDTKFVVKSNLGTKDEAEIVAVTQKHDLCVLAIDDSYLPHASIAREYPEKGERVYNIAAPLGMWQPGTTNRFDGYYSGPYRCEDDDVGSMKCKPNEEMWSWFTFPAIFGSSGSPIFNSRNELIGITVMLRPMFHHVIYATRLEDIIDMMIHVHEFERRRFLGDPQPTDIDVLHDLLADQ